MVHSVPVATSWRTTTWRGFCHWTSVGNEHQSRSTAYLAGNTNRVRSSSVGKMTSIYFVYGARPKRMMPAPKHFRRKHFTRPIQSESIATSIQPTKGYRLKTDPSPYLQDPPNSRWPVLLKISKRHAAICYFACAGRRFKAERNCLAVFATWPW
jgi:hypothetical protein